MSNGSARVGVNVGDVTGPRWVGGANGVPVHAGVAEYEALVKDAREYSKGGSFAAVRFGRLADAVEALAEENEKMRSAENYQKLVRDIEVERDALRAQLDASCSHPFSRLKFDGGRRALVCINCDRIVTHWVAAVEGEGVSDGQQ